MKTVDCPNCGGTGRGDMIPMKGGNWEKGMCSICVGSGQVPEWDYARLARLVSVKRDSVQIEMLLE